MNRFTFHYVSTYTPPRRVKAPDIRNLHSTMFLLIRDKGDKGDKGDTFTFHYVSTYTDPDPEESRCHTHLHSTMFLLIQSSPLILPHTFHIYIPLCFYLYLPAIRMRIRISQFTFHYVSTYTGSNSNGSHLL